MIDVRRLAAFRAVVATGSFSAAAEQLVLTQPAVTRQVQLLEREVGHVLLYRTRAGAVPTPAGTVLLGHAEVVLERLELAQRHLDELAGLRRGRLRLGAFFTGLARLAPLVHAQLQHEHPDLRFEVTMADRQDSLHLLARGELDAALVFDHDFAPRPLPDDVESVPLLDEAAHVLLPVRHPLADRDTLMLDDLLGETWIQPYEGAAADLITRVLTSARRQPAVIRSGHGAEPIEAQALVAAGTGIVLGHDLGMLIQSSAIVTRPFEPEAPVRRIQTAILRGTRSAPISALLDVLEDVACRVARDSPTLAPTPTGTAASPPTNLRA